MNFDKTFKKIEKIKDLYDHGQYEMALSLLNAAVRRGIFEADEQWVVDDCYSRTYYQMGEVDIALDYAWKSINEPEGQNFRTQQWHFSDYLFMLHYSPRTTDALMRERHFLYDQFATPESMCHHSHARHRHDRIRIGYLANSFRGGVITLFCWPMIVGYDRSRFEVYCYALEDVKEEGGTLDAVRSQVKVLRSYKWGQMKAEIVRDIYEDEIDILVDLNVHASGGCTAAVMCHRPAPVQVAGIGYMATSGTRAVDYFIGDRYCDPPGAERDFKETLLRLPSHFCYTPLERARAVKRTYALTDHIRFATFNNGLKINPEVAAAWAEILRRVPGSTLLVKGASGKKYMTQERHRMLLAAGIPAERIRMEKPSHDFLQRYMDVDIQLDTFPYVGGATMADSLFMGVPVVTRYGKRHGTRFGYSMLMQVGLGELASPDTEGYIERAVALAEDRQLLAALHAQLPERMRQSPLMDSRGYIRELETCYEEIWQRWLRGPEEADEFPTFCGVFEKGNRESVENKV